MPRSVPLRKGKLPGKVARVERRAEERRLRNKEKAEAERKMREGKAKLKKNS